MSTTVDTKVVEMQFNNKQFEDNVKESMATLKALKEQLKETESAKGLTGLADAVNKIDLSGISASIGKIEDRFSTMGIVGMTVVQNLTNTAINGLESIASRMLGMIKTGGLSRAMNIEQAKFQLAGLKIAWDDVGDAINYAVADTAYGLDAAALAASTLAASGVDYQNNIIDTLTAEEKAANGVTDNLSSMGMALKAISGVAAQTNSDYASMAHIFGTVAGQGRLMTNQLQMLETRGLNAAAKIGEVIGKSEKEVREMVSKGKIDFDTFSTAMYKQFAAHASDANKTLSGVTSNVKAAFSKIGAAIASPIIANEGPLVNFLNTFKTKVNEIKNVIVETGGFTETLSNTIIDIIQYADKIIQKFDPETFGKKLNKLATVFKAFTKNEIVDKGFFTNSSVINADTYAKLIEKLGGDSETLQESLMDAAKAISGINVRDKVKEYGSFTATLKDGWLTVEVWKKAFANIKEKIDNAGKSVTAVTMTVKELDAVASKVIKGDFGNGTARIEALTKAGYNWALVQNKVNEKLGCTVRHATDLSEAELKASGLTEEQAKKFKELANQADNANKSIEEIFEQLAKPSASDLLFMSLANVLSCFKSIKKAAIDAWKEMFPNKIDYSNIFYSIAEAINKLSEAFVINDKKADKLKRTFKGVYAIADVIRRVISAGLNLAFKTFSAILENLHLSVLDITSSVGDAAVAFREWYIQNDFIGAIANTLASVLTTLITKIGNLIKAAKESESIQNSIEIFRSIGDFLKNLFTPAVDSAKESIDNLEKTSGKTAGLSLLETVINGIAVGAKYIVTGLSLAIATISNFIKKASESEIVSSVIETGKNAFTTAWGIVKPIIDGMIEHLNNLFTNVSNMNSVNLDGLTSVFTSAKDKIVGAITGINDKAEEDSTDQNGGFFGKLHEKLKEFSGKFNIDLNAIGESLSKFKDKVVGFIGGVDIKTIAALGLVFGEFFALFKIVSVLGDVAKTVMAPFQAFEGVCKAFGNLANSAANTMKIASIVLIAVAISIVISSLKKLADADPKSLAWAVGEMIGVILSLALLAKGLGAINPISFSEGANMIMKLGAAVALIAIALTIITRLADGNKIMDAVKVLGLVMLELSAFTILLSSLAPKMSSGSTFLLSFSASILLLSIALNALLLINVKAVNKKLQELAGLFVLLGLMMTAARIAGKNAGSFGLGMLAISAGLLVLVGVLRILSLIEFSEISRGMKIMGMLSAMFILIGLASRVAGETAGKSWKEFVAMAGVITLMVGLIIIINLISTEQIIKGMAVISAISILFGALMLCASEVKNNNTVALGMLAGTLLILVGALYILSTLDDMNKVMIASGSLILVIDSLALLAHTLGNMKGNDVERAKTVSLLMAGLIFEIALVLGTMISIMKDSSTALAAAGSLSGIMLAMIACIKIMATVKPRETTNVTKTIQELGIIMLAMAALISVMSHAIKDPQSAIASATALSMVLLAITGSMRLLTNIKGHSKDKGTAFYAQLWTLTGIIGAIASILILMDKAISDPEKAIASATAIDIILIALTGCGLAINKFATDTPGKGMEKALATMGALEILLAGLAAVLWVVDKATNKMKNVDQSIKVLYALVPVLAALSLLALAIGALSGLATVSVEGVAAMSVSVVVLGAALGGLAILLKIIDSLVSSMTNVDQSIKVMYQLVGILAILGVLAIALGVLGVLAVGSMAGAVSILVLEVPLYGLIKLLEIVGGIQNADKHVETLAKLVGILGVMTVLVGALGVFGLLTPFILAGEIALGAMEVLLLGLIGLTAVVALFNTSDQQIAILAKLVIVMSMMATVIEMVGSVGAMSLLAAPALAGLEIVLTSLAALATTMGGVFTIFSGLEDVMDKGIEVLIKLSDGLGQIIGVLIEDIGTAIADTLPSIGEGLGKFALTAMPFFTTMMLIPDTIGETLAALGAGLVAMFAGDVINKIITAITGESSLESFGSALVALGDGLCKFAVSTVNVNPEQVKDKAEAVGYLAEASKKLSKEGGFVQKVIGTTKSLGTFAEELEAIGPALVTVSDVGNNENFNKESVENVASCISALGTAAQDMVATGGLWQKAAGETKSLKSFAYELTTGIGNDVGSTIGEAVLEISKVGSDKSFKKSNVEAVANSISALGDAAKSLVKDDGILQDITGHTKNLKQFAYELTTGTGSNGKTIGEALMMISNQGGLVNLTFVERMADCITKLNSALPENPNILEKWFGGGQMTMGEFGEELNVFAEAMTKFVSTIGESSVVNMNKVGTITTFINTLAAATSDSGVSIFDTFGSRAVIESFGENIKEFGQGIVDYSQILSGLDNEALTMAVYGIGIVAQGIDKMMDIASKVDKAKVTMKSAGKALVEALCSAISSRDSEGEMAKAASSLINSFVSKVNEGRSAAVAPFEALSKQITNIFTSSNGTFLTEIAKAGKYFTEGLTRGIQNEDATSSLYKACDDMGKKCVKTIKDATEEQSPSKATKEIGMYLDKGLEIGIRKYAKCAVNAASDVGVDTVDAMNTMINQISEAVESNSDFNPTITPVMDLSNIGSGIGTLNAMMNGANGITAGVSINSANTIGRRMSRTSISATNDDIVNSIDKLGTQLESISANNYTINGITYGDDSAVASAIQTLINATIVGGRV